LGFDYITGKTSVGDGELEFADQLFGDAKVKANLDDVIDDQDSFAFIFGARLNRNFGLEAFYQQSFEDNHFSQIDNETLLDNGLDYTDYHLMNNYTTSFRAYGLDLIGYLPLSAYFDFVGSVGVAHYNFVNDASFGVYYLDKFDNRGSTKTDFDDDGIGIRAGLGIQVNIIENVALRLMYKYIHIGGDIVDNLNEFSCGVRFLF